MSRCIQQSCYEECDTDEDCSGNLEMSCQSVDRGGQTDQSINVCATTEFLIVNNEPGNTMCEEDEVCRQVFLDDRARCSLLGSCIIPAEEHALLLTDRSMRGQPGAELLAVYLEPPSSSPEAAIKLTVESYLPIEPLTGDIPEGWNTTHMLDATQMCVANVEDTSALALGGDGGTLRLFAQDTQGARQLLTEGWSVVIIERGPACVDTEIADPIEIALCVSLAGDELDNTGQCTRILPPQGEGRTTAVISFDSLM